ncbi:MAG: hypothetical protein ACK473_11370 [Sphingomonadales bacterium]|jgi:hypothetical protein
MLRDLKDFALQVRDARSRENILEAITCYEASAYRAAIASTWTAVVYDFIAKIDELAQEGDSSAVSFKNVFDNARKNNNINKMLSIENDITERAFTEYQFINDAEKHALDRLKADRNKCSHPAFVSNDQIFQPSNELARYYIAMSLESVLTKPAIFGKTILTRYSNVIKGGLFPSEKLHAISYVKTNFLDKMRLNFIRNFCIVISKALLKEIPDEWKTTPRTNLSHTLQAISQFNNELWENDWRHEVVKIEENSDTSQRRTFIGLMGLIPSLSIAVNGEFLDRARVSIDTYDYTKDSNLDVFLGIRVISLRKLVLNLFNNQDQDIQARIIKNYPELDYWEKCLENLKSSSSFRGAETLYDDFIVPYNKIFEKHMFIELISVVMSNSQIWDSGGIPTRLASTAISMSLTGITTNDLVVFRDFLQENRRLDSYNEMFIALKDQGIDMYHDQNVPFIETVPF